MSTPIPVTAYYRNANWALWQKQKINGVETKSYILLAVLATQYPTEQAIKEVFYLDHVKAFIKENIGGVEVVGYVCGVVKDSFNYNMRSIARINGLDAKEKIGASEKKVRLLNDPFRTKGRAVANIISTTKAGVLIRVTCYSAFFLPTESYGIFDTEFGGVVGAGGTAFNEIIFQGFVSGQVVNLTPYCVNEEGKYTGSESWTVPRVEIVLSEGNYASDAYYNYQNPTSRRVLYMDLGGDDKFYLFPSGSNAVGAGYFANNEEWFNTDGNGVVIASGYVNEWPEDDPNYDPYYEELIFNEFTSSAYGPTCNFMTRPDYEPTPNIKIYRHKTNGKYYQNGGSMLPENNALVADGYYFSGASTNPVDVTFIHIINGVLFSSGDCLNGENIS